MDKVIFIAGTDTEVGKTTVACSIVRNLRKRKAKVGVMKPVSSGGREDAMALREAAGAKDPLDEINPFHLRHPMAPGVACRLENRDVDFSHIKNILLDFCRRYDIIICETAGGVESPITADLKTNIDLMRYLDGAALLVARPGLGTINHTVLSVSALRREGVKIIGIILNGTKRGDIVERTNPEVIREMTSLPVLSVLPYTKYKKNLDNRLQSVKI